LHSPRTSSAAGTEWSTLFTPPSDSRACKFVCLSIV
jgi:hypothetical protein